MYTGKLGVALIAYNRPHYFKQLIRSLEAQSYLDNTDFHLFQDGPLTRNDIRLVSQSMGVFNAARLPNKSITKQRKNVSIAINQFEAVEHMVARYQYVIIIEDDLILSPSYLRLIRVLVKQYGENEKIFGYSLNFLRRCAPRNIEKNLHKVKYLKEHWWAECFSAKQWAVIRPYFMEYYNLVKGRKYSERPHFAIRKLFRDHGLIIPQTSQDAGKDYAVYRAGLKRVNSVVNRGLYIGTKGTHFTETLAKKYQFENQVPYEFAEDELIEGFTLTR